MHLSNIFTTMHLISNHSILTAKFGTTPEKLAEGRDIISRDAAEAKAPLKSPSHKKPIPSNLAGTASSNATFSAQLPKAAPQFSLSESSASAFPPMPTHAPKPLSQSLNQNKPEAPTLSKSTSTPAKSESVDYKSALTKFYQENSPGKVADVDKTLQKYKVRRTKWFDIDFTVCFQI